MAEYRNHVDEPLQELLDGRLAPVERLAVEAHLLGCERCRRLRASLEPSRAALRSAPNASEVTSAALRRRILAALDEEDRARATLAAPRVLPGGRFRLAWATAALVVLAVGALLLFAPPVREVPPADPVDRMAESYRGLVSGQLVVEHALSAPADLEHRFAAGGLPFRARVLDLSMMGFELAGGRIQRLSREPSALMVYRRAGGSAGREDLLACEMYRGRLADLPLADRIARRGNFTFHLFRRGVATLVFWQEGELVCALVGGGDAAALLDLAAAKAMLAPAV